MRWGVLLFNLVYCTLCFARGISATSAVNDDVLRIARSYKDGGEYNWKGSGTPEAILFAGKIILPKGKGTFCSGYTFAVAMRAATERGLLKGKKVEEIQRFQQEWYGATKKSSEVQAGYAMKRLGIGQTVKFNDAREGDFTQLWRANKTGHSVIFLGWVLQDEKKIGFRYRSTQEATEGIGDRTEYFSDVSGRKGEVLRKRTYFARLNVK